VRRRAHLAPAALAALLALLVGSSAGAVVEMVHTCVRCVCACISSPCDPANELPGPCALDDATLDPFGQLCDQICADGGGVGKLVEIEVIGNPCRPCPVTAPRTAAPTAGATGLGGLALVLLGSGVRRLRRRRSAR
jgi:hypothetical protein